MIKFTYNDNEYRIFWEQQSYRMVYIVLDGRWYQLDIEERDNVVAQYQFEEAQEMEHHHEMERPGLW